VREELSALRTANDKLETEVRQTSARAWANSNAAEQARIDVTRLADRVLRMEAVHMGVVDQLDPENAPAEAAKRFDRYVDFVHLRYTHDRTVKQLEESRARVVALEASNAEMHAILDEHVQKDTPSVYLCPITHAIMDDPVMAADGFAYERRDIARHITTSGVVRSPVTRAFMMSQLTPLPFLKRGIEEWKAAHKTHVVVPQ
jgi:hypothetical protein